MSTLLTKSTDQASVPVIPENINGPVQGPLDARPTSMDRLNTAVQLFRNLIFLGIIIAPTACNKYEEQGPDDVSLASVEELSVMQRVEKGDWQFTFFNTVAPLQINDNNGSTLYAFINAHVETLFPYGISDDDKLNVVDALIQISRDLNPEMNLDNFQSLNGKEIIFPTLFLMDFQPTSSEIAGLQKISKYSRLQEVAQMQGYAISNVSQQNAIFEHAQESGQEVGAQGDGYFRAEGYQDSPAIMNEAALRTFKQVAKRFRDETRGWSLSYTHVLRDQELQAAQNNGVSATTHYTGNTIDITDGRFLNPQGQEVTYSANRDLQAYITETLRPILERILLEEGVMVFHEVSGGHYHLYMPPTLRIVCGAKNADEEIIVEGTAEPMPAAFEMSPELQDLNEHLFNVIQGLADSTEPAMSDEDLAISLASIHSDYDLIGSEGVRWFLNILKMFNTPGLVLTEEEEHASISDINVRMRLLSQQEIENPELERLKTVARQKIYERAISVLNTMTPEQSRQHRLILGTVFDYPGKTNFSDLSRAWSWKLAEKSKKKHHDIYAATQEQLEGRSNSVDMADWLDQQNKACKLLQSYGVDMGFDARLLPYINPGLILAVTNAEFASDFSGEEYINIAPTLFHDYNLVFGPAVNDREYSAGVVQMVAETFTSLLNRYKTTLTHIRAEQERLAAAGQDSYDLKVPQKTRGRYDAAEHAEAQLTHVPSQLFYGALAVANHIELGTEHLFENPTFEKAWTAASVEEKSIFLSAFSAMSINIGRAGAYKVAKKLDKMPEDSTMAAFTNALSDKTYSKKSLGRRGATAGSSCMRALLNQEAPIVLPPAESEDATGEEATQGFSLRQWWNSLWE